MTKKDQYTQNKNPQHWLFDREMTDEANLEHMLWQKNSEEQFHQKEREKFFYLQRVKEVFDSKNVEAIIQMALEWVPFILSDSDLKIVQKVTKDWLDQNGDITLSDFDSAKNLLENQKHVGIFASIMNIISEAKNFQNNFLNHSQNMITNTQNFQDENNNLPTWLDEDVSTTSKELPEWLQPGPDYVPPTAESEEEFQKRMNERRRAIMYLYKNLGIKAVVNFLWEEQTMYDMGDFTFFDQISKSDLHTIYQFAEKYMKLSTKKLEWKEGYQNEVEKMNFYESARKITESAAFLHLLLLTRQEIDDISKYL